MSKFIKIIFLVILNISLLFSFSTKASEKIKIGLLVPMSGSNKDLGQSIIKAVRLAIKDINSNSIEIIPKDTASRANKALKSAFELKLMGVKVVIGPVFYESITYLDEINDITFLNAPIGDVYPENELPITDRTLTGFTWRQKERPATLNDLFDKHDKEDQFPSILKFKYPEKEIGIAPVN